MNHGTKSYDKHVNKPQAFDFKHITYLIQKYVNPETVTHFFYTNLGRVYLVRYLFVLTTIVKQPTLRGRVNDCNSQCESEVHYLLTPFYI